MVLDILATRHPVALPPQAIRRRAAIEMDFTLEDADVIAALELLAGLGLVKSETDSLGSMKYWNATAAGVLAFERGVT